MEGRRRLIHLLTRRPVLLMAIALALLIWLGRMTGLYDPGGRQFPEIQDRHLTVAGTVAGREAYAGGCRVILDSLSFLADGSGSFRNTIPALNERLHSSDRMLVSLTMGTGIESDLYGNPASESYKYGPDQQEDQTVIFLRLHTGDRVIFRGKCAQPEQASNPGQFDLRSYYHARSVYFTLRDAELREVVSGDVSLKSAACIVRDVIDGMRYRIQRGLREVFGQEDASYMAAMLLGDKSGLSTEKRQVFRDGGIAYLLAVSALHVTLAGRAVYRLLRRLRRSFLFSASISSLILILYVIMTGGSVSAQRACIMFIFWASSQIPGRTEDRLTSLSGAVLFILMRQPYALFDSSFQISCTCILSMELLPGAIFRVICPGRSRNAEMDAGGHGICRMILVPLSIQIGTLPVFLYWYYQICPYTWLLHTVLLTAMSLMMGFGMCAAACAMILNTAAWTLAVFHPAGLLLAGPCHYLITFFLLICRAMQELPFSVIITGRPHIIQILVYYVILAAFILLMRNADRRVLKENRRKVRAAGVMAFFGLIGLITFRVRPRFRFTCLDIGQGSCNLIECGDCACLFDAGSSSVDNVWLYRIDSTLKYYGISRVDTVFLSHADTDHINGIEQMLAMYHRNLAGMNAADVTIGQILLPDLPQDDERMTEIIRQAGRCKIPVGCVSEGADLQANGMNLRVLGPSVERIAGDANQDCIVLQACCGGISILMTGDLEKEGEEMFIRHYRNDAHFNHNENEIRPGEDYRILIAGHHGSGNATSESMLDLVKPDLVLISCGRNNRYGHPAGEMLERLKAYGVPWRRTDLEGALCIETIAG